MTNKITAEEFVRNVLAKTFNQRVDKDTLREVAQKVNEAIARKPATASKGARPQRAA
jgi:hypothetical protein